MTDANDRIAKAIDFAVRYGGIDGDHHKSWVIDQMVRALTACPKVDLVGTDCRGSRYEYSGQGESEEYLLLVANACAGSDGPATYEWAVGTPP